MASDASNQKVYERTFVLAGGRRDEVRVAQAEVLGEVEARQFTDPSCFAIRLALEEALSNAFRHGNAGDPDKTVRLECRIEPDQVMLAVEDEGSGFDPHAVPDPTAEPNLHLPSGRGIMLMRSFMTEVDFNARGNRVRMVFRRPDS